MVKFKSVYIKQLFILPTAQNMGNGITHGRWKYSPFIKFLMQEILI